MQWSRAKGVAGLCLCVSACGGSLADDGANGGTAGAGKPLHAGRVSNHGGAESLGGQSARTGGEAIGGPVHAASNAGGEGAAAMGGAVNTGGFLPTGDTVSVGGAALSGGPSTTGGSDATGGIDATGGARSSGGATTSAGEAGSAGSSGRLTARAIGASTVGGHTCALLDDGSVTCWGRNDYGQLGNGSTINSAVPVAVFGITSATAIAVGGLHTCALLDDGSVTCWGRNDYGQLGLGYRSDASHYLPGLVLNLGSAVLGVERRWPARKWHYAGQYGSGTRGRIRTRVTPC
jgi:hypothetical protein